MSADGEIDTWRLDRLGDEPLYCAAPTPDNPDDILCYGSDEDLDAPAKVAKRLCYEEKGLRYLRGEPVRLLSATLLGPFDKASGWKNPWLPKRPTKPLPNENLSLPPDERSSAPAIKKSFLRDLKLWTASGNASTPESGNSLQCHLPSPESNRSVEASHEYMDAEEHGRIKAWASGVSMGPLEKDSFWAPTKTDGEQKNEPSRKRSAAEEWLKKPTKRTRPYTAQSAEAASTPMPLHARKPSVKKLPFSIRDTERNQSNAPQSHPDCSFELATPSSTADRRPEVPVDVQGGATAAHGGDRPTRARRATSSTAISSLTGLSDISERLQASPGKTVTAARDSPTNPIQEPESDSRENVSEDSGQDEIFESFLDQSFHYRARPPKEAMHLGDSPTIQAKGAASHRAQDTNSELSEHNGIETSSLSSVDPESHSLEMEPKEDDSQSQTITDPRPPAQDPAVTAQRQGTPIHAPIAMGYDTTTDSAQVPPPTGSPAKRGYIAGEDTPQNSQPSQKKTRLEQSRSSQETDSSGNVRDAERLVAPADGNSALGDDSMDATVVAESMDVNEASCAKPCDMSEPTCTTDSTTSEKCTVEKGPAMESVATDTTNNGISGEESDNDSDRIILPLSQLEWGIVNHTARPTPKFPPNHQPKPATKAGSDFEDNKENIPIVPAELGQNHNSQTLCVSDTTTTTTTNQSRIKQEPRDHDDDDGLALADIPMSSSSLQMYQPEPERIRASQQSPWVGDAPSSPMASGSNNGSGVVDVGARHKWMAIVMNEPPTSLGEEDNPPRSSSPSIRHTLTTPTPVSNTQEQEQEQEIEKADSQHSGSRCPETPPPPAPAPTTPAAATARPSTPEPVISIKSFATFNTPSPLRQRSSHAKSRHASTGRRSGILRCPTPRNPWDSAKTNSTRRVSFAPLPGDDDDAGGSDEAADAHLRPASPPPEVVVEAGDEDVNDTFHKHFDAVKRRGSSSSSTTQRAQKRPRLLPSESQQQQPPASPGIGAMAEAFQAADALAHHAAGALALAERHIEEAARREESDVEPADTTTSEPAGEEGGGQDEAADEAAPQSPWRVESQPVDHVEAVLDNLDQFLDAWDVDAAMQQASFDDDPSAPTKNVDVLSGVGIWD